MSEQLRKQLRDWKKKNMRGSGKSKSKQNKGKRSGKDMSTRDIEELMGMNRPTYKRGKGGAYRQK